MKGIFKSSYVKNGVRTFVFKVTGTEEEKTAYLAMQEANAKKQGRKTPATDEDGEPLFWSNSPTGKNITIMMNENNAFEDTSELALNASAQANADFSYNQVMNNLKARAGQGAPRVNVNAGAEPIDK